MKNFNLLWNREAAQYLPKGCSRKLPPSFVHFNGAVCSNTHFFLDLFRANSTCKGSRTPRLAEHFWVPILGASCSNKLFVGTLRPSQRGTIEKIKLAIRKGKIQLRMFFSIRAPRWPQQNKGRELKNTYHHHPESNKRKSSE